MDEHAVRALESELGGKLPPSLARLDREDLRDLTEAVKEARRRQAAELKAAGEQALQHIPRVLRGPVRKIAG